MQIGNDKLIIDKSNIINYVIGMRDNLSPVLGSGVINIDCDDASAGRIKVSVEVKDRIIITNEAISSVGSVK